MLNRRILLARRPTGLVQADDFSFDEQLMPPLQDGEARLQVLYLGIDPTIRTWLSTAKSYLPPIQIGEVVRSAGVGRVVESKAPTLEVGQLITTLTGWQQYVDVTDHPLATVFPSDTDPRHALGLLGSSGLAAYVGAIDVGRIQQGDTVVVSGAAGATGSVVGQIAKIKGARAVGIAGSAQKCRHVVEDLGFDACINYGGGVPPRVRSDPASAHEPSPASQSIARAPRGDLPGEEQRTYFREALRAACPKRIDVYFDNVGGWILNDVLGRLAMGARVVLCGAISVYNEDHKPPGPANYLNLISMRASMSGFNGMDHWARHPQISAQLKQWYDDGQLRYREHVVDGLSEAWQSVNMLFTGENIGKVLVKV